MPINPNIALGVQPIQQPNMLGQMGQIMALKAAQQETEGYEGVKGAIASGMSPNDPRMLQFGPRGVAAYKAAGEGAVKQQELLAKSFENNLAGIGAVRSKEDLINYSVGQLSDPYVGPWLKSRGITAEKLTANLEKEIATLGFDAALKKSSMKMVDFYKDQTSIENNKRTVGASYYSSNVSRDNSLRTDERMREQQAFERDKRSVIAGEGQFLQTDAYGNVYPVAQYGATRGPNAPAQPLPPAAANAFVTARPSVNAFAPTAQPQGAGPTVAAAAAMDAQNNVPRPKVPYTAPVAVMKDGKPVLVQGREAMGLTPATDFTIKQAAGREETVRSLDAAIRNLELVVKPGGLLEKSTGSGAGRLYDTAKGFFGGSTEGAIAAAELAPIADLVLKMVPRFEGPQGVKDVESYERAAGRLADASLPNDIRAGAAKIILKLMKERKDQFAMKGQEGGSGGASGGAPADPLGIR